MHSRNCSTLHYLFAVHFWTNSAVLLSHRKFASVKITQLSFSACQKLESHAFQHQSTTSLVWTDLKQKNCQSLQTLMRPHVSICTGRTLQNKNEQECNAASGSERAEELLQANNMLKTYDCIQIQTLSPGKVASC